jgi:hypothetical protein
MARQTYYVTREQRHPLYKTRMLTAGQALPLDASAVRLFRQLGVELSDTPKKAKPAPVPTTEEVLTAEVVEAPKPAPRKTAPRKRTTRKAKAKK